jgi:hypothetical protein
MPRKPSWLIKLKFFRQNRELQCRQVLAFIVSFVTKLRVCVDREGDTPTGTIFLLANTINQGLSAASYEFPPDNTTNRSTGVSARLIKTHGKKSDMEDKQSSRQGSRGDGLYDSLQAGENGTSH